MEEQGTPRAPGCYVGLRMTGRIRTSLVNYREGVQRHLAAILPAGFYLTSGLAVPDILPLVSVEDGVFNEEDPVGPITGEETFSLDIGNFEWRGKDGYLRLDVGPGLVGTLQGAAPEARRMKTNRFVKLGYVNKALAKKEADRTERLVNQRGARQVEFGMGDIVLQFETEGGEPITPYRWVKVSDNFGVWMSDKDWEASVRAESRRGPAREPENRRELDKERQAALEVLAGLHENSLYLTALDEAGELEKARGKVTSKIGSLFRPDERNPEENLGDEFRTPLVASTPQVQSRRRNVRFEGDGGRASAMAAASSLRPGEATPKREVQGLDSLKTKLEGRLSRETLGDFVSAIPVTGEWATARLGLAEASEEDKNQAAGHLTRIIAESVGWALELAIPALEEHLTEVENVPFDLGRALLRTLEGIFMSPRVITEFAVQGADQVRQYYGQLEEGDLEADWEKAAKEKGRQLVEELEKDKQALKDLEDAMEGSESVLSNAPVQSVTNTYDTVKPKITKSPNGRGKWVKPPDPSRPGAKKGEGDGQTGV